MAPSASDRQAMMAGLRDVDEHGHARGPEDARAKKLRENQEQRVLRGEMREQMNEATDIRKDMTNLSAAQIEDFIHKGDARFARVNRPQEAALDSKAFMTAARTAALKARQLKVDQNAFDTNEFLLRLKKKLGQKRARVARAADSDTDSSDDEADQLGDWTAIGWLGVKYTKRIVLPDFALGPLGVTPKARTTHKRARLEIAKHKAAEPEAVVKESTKKDANESSTLTHLVEGWLSTAYTYHLERDEPLNFFEFVVDPLSFNQTIENIFYLSFSIAKGVAAVEINEETGMLELMSSEPADANAADEGVAKLQMVMEMDMQTWKDAIELFKIRENRWIPHRPPVDLEPGKYYK